MTIEERVEALAQAINAMSVWYALRNHMGGITDQQADLDWNARLSALYFRVTNALDDLIPGASDAMFWSQSAVIAARTSIDEAVKEST